MRENCKTSTSTATKSVKYNEGGCEVCKTNFFPYNFRDMYICLEQDFLTFHKGNTVLDANCSQYKYDSSITSYVCEGCKNGYFLTSAAACATTCGTDNAFVAFLDVTTKLIKKNICVATGDLITGVIAGCKVYVFGYKGPGANVDKLTDSCFICDANRLPTVNLAVAFDHS